MKFAGLSSPSAEAETSSTCNLGTFCKCAKPPFNADADVQFIQ